MLDSLAQFKSLKLFYDKNRYIGNPGNFIEILKIYTNTENVRQTHAKIYKENVDSKHFLKVPIKMFFTFDRNKKVFLNHF